MDMSFTNLSRQHGSARTRNQPSALGARFAWMTEETPSSSRMDNGNSIPSDGLPHGTTGSAADARWWRNNRMPNSKGSPKSQ